MKKGAELHPLDIPSCDRKALKFGKATLVTLYIPPCDRKSCTLRINALAGGTERRGKKIWDKD